MSTSSNTKPFGTVPATVKQQPEPFELRIDQQTLDDFKTLLRLSPIAKETYENVNTNGESGAGEDGIGKFGISREWIKDAKRIWLEVFDWRTQESQINTFPHFTTPITDALSNHTFTLHFVALFSLNPSAIPLTFLHGWPGSFLEFLPILSLLRERYTPETLPYHIIVPSLPGYTLSSAPPLDRDWGVADTARVIHELLLSLGFGKGYVVQGGDIGSMVARTMGVHYAECKAVHLNFCFMLDPPSGVDPSPTSSSLSEEEKIGMKRMDEFNQTGNAYGRMHGTRPSTVGLVLSSSPLALLAWIAEKFLSWSDSPHPSLQTILTSVTLYWLTESFPTSIYTYREDFGPAGGEKGYFHGRQSVKLRKPLGYSWFPRELMPIPREWAEGTVEGGLSFFRSHGVGGNGGGHFAALERPAELWGDVEEFVGKVWKEE